MTIAQQSLKLLRGTPGRIASVLAAGTAITALALAMSQLNAADSEAFTVDAASFDCITEMTPVRGFFVNNLLGNLEATLAVARSTEGGRYPVGSVVQLVPSEVMVKLAPGSSPATNDWEYLELQVSAEGTRIAGRGFTDVVNRFGGNCFDCHVKAEDKWDQICETGHGCDPLPISRTVIEGIQKSDPRCKAPEQA